MMKKLISVVLVLATLFSLCVPSVAAGTEEFVSEVALVYEDSVEEALEAIEGTDWKLFENDLNPMADFKVQDGVYLIYKTSTNVEDAITDLRVMDMYGGFNVNDYEKQLEKTREAYLQMITYIRTAADEFATAYNSGDRMAELAYRQMNYYKDITGTELLMGDFFLNLPDDTALVTAIMEGNSYIVTNLISLLAVGVAGDGTDTLPKRIKDMYAVRDTLTHEKYYDAALSLSNEMVEIEADLIEYEALSEQYDITDETMTEEEYQFLLNYGATAMALEKVSYGEVSLKDFILAGEWTIEDLYPIVAAFSPGQAALSEMGMFSLVLQYSTPTKDINALFDQLTILEEDMKDESGVLQPIDLYIGVDRSLFHGAYAFTSAAERHQALTGENFNPGFAGFSDGAVAAAITVGALGLMCALTPTILTNIAGILLKVYGEAIATAIATHTVYLYGITWYNRFIIFVGNYVIGYGAVFAVCSIGLLFIAAGILGVSDWYNYYNPDYTEIPSTMIDVRETDIGDRYIKYSAAKVFGVEEDMNADFNAFQGKQWNALYYTKDATAGYSLTPNFVYRLNNSTISRRHQGVCKFGENVAYDLNSHVFNGNADGVYLTVRYSTTKKAAADVPDVVASILAQGAYYALSAFSGALIGVGVMFAFQKKSKKKARDTAEE